MVGSIDKIMGVVPARETVELESDSRLTSKVTVEVEEVPSKGPVKQ